MKFVAITAALTALASTTVALSTFHREHVALAHKARMASPEPTPNAVGHVNHLQKRFGPGRMTFYDVGLGACGIYSNAGEFVVALNSAQFGGYAVYPGPNCFRSIIIEYNGRQVGAQIVDECPTCGFGDLDLSRGLFAQFAGEGEGVFYATWWFTDGPPPSPPPTTTEQPWTQPTTTQPTTTQPEQHLPTSTSTTDDAIPPASNDDNDLDTQDVQPKSANNLYTFGKVVVQLAGIIGHGGPV